MYFMQMSMELLSCKVLHLSMFLAVSIKNFLNCALKTAAA